MQIKKLILLICVLITSTVGSNAQIEKNIQFIPKEFSNVESMFDTNAEHSLTPFYPHFFCEVNNIRINAPEKIIVTAMDSSSKLILPLCGYCHVSIKRAMKYAEQEAYLIHIKKIEAEDWYCGEIWQPSVDNEVIDTEDEEERQIAIEKAKSYTDDELDEGGGHLNLLMWMC